MIKVLVVHSDLMLGAGIENLLARENDLLVKGTTAATTMSSESEQFHPNVIVLDDTLSFADLSQIFEMLKGYPELRVMVINLHNNRVNVYEKYEVSIQRTSDLVNAIRQSMASP